jgi:transcriptional regulator with XRE-family HTH domain
LKSRGRFAREKEGGNVPDARFGCDLRRLRRQAGRSLADLADVLGCSIAYVSAVERGQKNPPSPKDIRRLLVFLDQESEYPKMLCLAVKARQSVEIPVNDKSEEVTDMLVALARRCDEGSLTDEVVEEIRKILETRAKQ